MVFITSLAQVTIHEPSKESVLWLVPVLFRHMEQKSHSLLNRNVTEEPKNGLQGKPNNRFCCENVYHSNYKSDGSLVEAFQSPLRTPAFAKVERGVSVLGIDEKPKQKQLLDPNIPKVKLWHAIKSVGIRGIGGIIFG